jgi:SIR2-like domain
MSLSDLKTAYRRDGLVLVLGAGLSRKSGLPTWAELLDELAMELIGSDGPGIVADLRSDGLSLPAIAGVLESHCKGKGKFADLVRDTLYRRFPYYGATLDRRKKDEFIVDVAAANPTLAAVAAFCAVSGSGSVEFDRNPLVRAIVNFNFDAIFRKYIFARYGRLVRTVERASKSSIPGRINVYHLHGYLRFDAKRDRRDKENDKLVFTEQEYFDFTADPLALFTYTFMHFLREHACLFIGSSMQDENLRRLLYRSFRERVKAYEEENERDAVKKSIRHFAILTIGGKSSRNSAAMSLERLGVRPVWIDGFEQIPALLGRTYEATGAKWSDVFPT